MGESTLITEQSHEPVAPVLVEEPHPSIVSSHIEPKVMEEEKVEALASSHKVEVIQGTTTKEEAEEDLASSLTPAPNHSTPAKLPESTDASDNFEIHQQSVPEDVDAGDVASDDHDNAPIVAPNENDVPKLLAVEEPEDSPTAAFEVKEEDQPEDKVEEVIAIETYAHQDGEEATTTNHAEDEIGDVVQAEDDAKN